MASGGKKELMRKRKSIKLWGKGWKRKSQGVNTRKNRTRTERQWRGKESEGGLLKIGKGKGNN